MHSDAGFIRRAAIGRLMRSMAIGAAGVVTMALAAPGQERPVVWSAEAVSATKAIVPGAIDTVRLTAQIAPGWHMYSISQGPGGPIPTRIALPGSQPFTLADVVKGPAPTQQFDPNFGIKVETYDTRAAFLVPVRVASDAPVGPNAVAVSARYQVCNATVCLPPRTDRVSVPVTIGLVRARPLSSTG